MIRALWFMLKVAVLIAAAIWLSDHPGTLTVEWLGHTVETSMAVAVVLVVVGAIALIVGYRLIRAIVNGPGAFGRFSRARRREKGIDALTRGMVAVAAGDADTAQRMAGRARDYLDQPPLTRLLSAQAAQMRGDDGAAKHQFQAMLSNPDTVFLGVRGLLTQALKDGDRVEALALARRAAELQPRTGWVLATLFDLEARAGEWAAAEETLKRAVKLGVIKLEAGRHHRAALLLERSFAAERQGREETALLLARDAHDLLPGFAPAAARAARLLAHTGKLRQASKVAHKTWRINQTPELAAAFREVVDGYPATARIDMFRKLAAEAPSSPESVIAVARAMLDAERWDQARAELEKARTNHPTRRVYNLLAGLERASGGDEAAAQAWAVQGLTAAADPAWVCRTCGTAHPTWAGLCGHCGAFDSFDWRAASKAPPVTKGEVTAVEAPPLEGRAATKTVTTVEAEPAPA